MIGYIFWSTSLLLTLATWICMASLGWMCVEPEKDKTPTGVYLFVFLTGIVFHILSLLCLRWGIQWR